MIENDVWEIKRHQVLIIGIVYILCIYSLIMDVNLSRRPSIEREEIKSVWAMVDNEQVPIVCNTLHCSVR